MVAPLSQSRSTSEARQLAVQCTGRNVVGSLEGCAREEMLCATAGQGEAKQGGSERQSEQRRSTNQRLSLE